MSRSISTPSSAKLDLAASTFLVFNGLAAGLFVGTVETTGGGRQLQLFLIEYVVKFVASVYALGIVYTGEKIGSPGPYKTGVQKS